MIAPNLSPETGVGASLRLPTEGGRRALPIRWRLALFGLISSVVLTIMLTAA